MGTRSRGPLAGFGWLKQGIDLCLRHPKPLFGGAAYLMLICILPSLIFLPIQFQWLQPNMQPGPSAFGWIMGGAMLLSLLIVPLYAGYLQVLETAGRGLPARARDVFKPYRGSEAWRLIGFGLVVQVFYYALIGAVLAATGGGFARWYMRVLSAQVHHQAPPATLPDGFGTTVALIVVLAIFMMGFYAVSFGQVALRRRGVFASIGDGIVGALKNVLPLLVFVVSLALAWVVVAIAFVTVVSLLALLGGLISKWLAVGLIVVAYVAMFLVTLAMWFGVMYALWRDVCGDDSASPGTPQIAA